MCLFHTYLHKSCPEECKGREFLNDDIYKPSKENYQIFDSFKGKKSKTEMESKINEFVLFYFDELNKISKTAFKTPEIEKEVKLTFAELRVALRSKGLKASGNIVELQERYDRFQEGKVEDNDYPKRNTPFGSDLKEKSDPKDSPMTRSQKRTQENEGNEVSTPKRKKNVESITPSKGSSPPLSVPPKEISSIESVPSENETSKIRFWLSSNGMETYLDRFIEHGFDNMDYIKEKGLDSDDFDLLDVKKAGHIKIFKWMIEKLRN
jgi:hypothetical protein